MKKIIAVLLIMVSISAFYIDASAKGEQSYTVIEQTSGRILYSVNGDKKMPMASTTKVMTAILVIENLELEKEYDIPDEAVGIEGSSMYLKKGERLTGTELLYGLMLSSGNDAAYALGILTSGSIEEFLTLMNLKAVELNMQNTHFSDPCGLKSENHYTTSNDLATLCAYAMKNQLFREIVCTKTYKAGERYLFNKNRILSELEGGNGIKTGYTKAAGRCLCSSAERDGMQVICVVLNNHNWFEDSKTLINKAFEEYSMVQIAQKEKIVSNANILGGKSKKCDIITKDDVYYPLKKGEYLKARYEVALEANAPVNKGDSAGKVVYFLDEQPVIEAECVFFDNVKRKTSVFGG